MGMTRRKKLRGGDKATTNLMRSGVLNVSQKSAHTHRPMREPHPPFSFWSAVRYTFVLSLLLWWMPTFGQMIAGYVGGRRAGGPWKGAIAAFIPVAIFMTILGLAEHGILTQEVSYVAGVPSYVASAIYANIPVMAPYIEFMTVYVTTFVESLTLTLGLGLNGYLVTVIFAYIGGVVSAQKRNELEYARAGVPTMITSRQTRARFASTPAPAATGWYDSPQRLDSMKKIPVAPGKAVAGQKKAAPRPAKASAKPAKPGKPAKTKKKQKKRAQTTDKDRERIGRKLTERAMRDFR
jgi:hypothetical protein